MDQLTEVPGDNFPGDKAASRFAYAAAVAGAAGVVTLGIMYAVEVPKGGPFIFGTTNDAIGGVFQLLVIPVVLQLHRRIPQGTGTEALKWTMVAACVAGSTSSFLLVFRVLEFNASTAVSVAAIMVQGAWFLLAHRRLLKVPGYPRQLGKLGRFIGAAVLTGLPVAGIGYVLPGPDWLRYTVMGIGGAVGVASWLAWPYWYYLAGRHLGHAPASAKSRGMKGAPPPAPA